MSFLTGFVTVLCFVVLLNLFAVLVVTRIVNFVHLICFDELNNKSFWKKRSLDFSSLFCLSSI